MAIQTNPIRPTDAQAISLAKSLISTASFGALAVLDPETQTPFVSRIAVGTTSDGTPLSLISDLSRHTRALRANPACSLLVGEPVDKGDPLSHPRLTLVCSANFLPRDHPDHEKTRARYLKHQPKAQLYIDFTDFSFVLFAIRSASLNGGFGKAYELTPSDIR